MRTLMIASAALALIGGAAEAQQRVVVRRPVGAGYGMPGGGAVVRPTPARPGVGPVVRPVPGRPGGVYGRPHGPRWGSKVNGYWWGGVNAPGGWNAYRRPYRGWALPGYWVSPRFYINDWSLYGLSQPAAGYTWVRYYNDAVLINTRGSVYDSVSDVDWDRYDGQYDAQYAGQGAYNEAGDDGYYANDAQVYAGPGDRGYHDNGYYAAPRQDNGLGGAAVGAVVGGIAGGAIAGPGNRVGGALIGAGVGAVTGYAVDKAEDRGRRAPPPPPPAPVPPRYAPAPGYGAGYAQPGYPAGYVQPVPVAPVRAPGGGWVSPDGHTTVTTSGGYYGGGSTTTIVVQSAPVVTTTTTTEYYDDAVSYTRPAPKVWKKKRVVYAKPRCTC